MSNKLRILIVALALLCVANVAWRLWAGRGRVTIDANDRPVAEVVRSLEKQAGIRIGSNVPAEAKVTMHVRKVPLLHALEVLAANTSASWSVAYFAAPDKATIDMALATMATGQQLEGWKHWSMPPMRGFADPDAGSIDPRLEEWHTKAADEPTLHAYLGQAANVLSAQFWAPEQWNPNVNSPPKAGRITAVMPKLANTIHGKSAEVFLLRARQPRPEFADAGDRNRGGEGRPGGGGPNIFGGPPSDEMRKAMEERVRAGIERLPKDKQAAALARMEEGRKFFEEMAKLSPEERRAKMEDRMEQMMNNSDTAARMSAEGTKRGAMQTAGQRADRYRGYLDRKREANQ